jgi:hybrid cluster-associated redox disulfide protein
VGTEVVNRVTTQATETINSTSAVDEVVTRFPTTARVFVGRRMHCVGCDVSRFETLAGAARVYRQPLEPLLADLRAAAGQAS